MTPQTNPVTGVLQLHERAVLELVTAGYPNREIADRLCLSMSSVESAIRTAYRKIDATSRVEAVRWGLDHAGGVSIMAPAEDSNETTGRTDSARTGHSSALFGSSVAPPER